MCCQQRDSVVILKSSFALVSSNACTLAESRMRKEGESIIKFSCKGWALECLSTGIALHRSLF